MERQPERELWRPIETIPGCYVSNLGRVRSRRENILNPKPLTSSGYVSVNFSGSGHRVHRLAAQAWLPNPENKPYVNHIDGDRANNKIENLEWVTAAENSQRKVYVNPGRATRPIVQLGLNGTFIRLWESALEAGRALGLEGGGITHCCRGVSPTAGGFRWQHADALEAENPEEEWRQSEDPRYNVSSLGRVRTKKGRILRGSGEPYLSVGGYSGQKSHLVHRLIAATFCARPIGKDVVNHKDGNKLNNAAANLEWVTPKENIQHASATGLIKPHRGSSRPVFQHLPDGSKIGWPSAAAAFRATKVLAQSILQVCRGSRKTAGGFCWSYQDPMPSPMAIDESEIDWATPPIPPTLDQEPLALAGCAKSPLAASALEPLASAVIPIFVAFEMDEYIEALLALF